MIVDYQHQIDVFNRFKNRDEIALFMETGTGKNRIMIKLAENHWSMGRINMVVVFTTSTLVMNWTMIELPMHSSVPYHVFVWKKSKNIRITPALYYLVVNVDAVSTPLFKKTWKAFREKYPKYMIIIDESTLVKNHKSKRTGEIVMLARRAKIRCIASGTPMPKNPLDIYSQMDILGHGRFGFTSYYAFKARYAVEIEEKIVRGGKLDSYKSIEGFKHMSEFTAKLGNIASIIRKTDCLDLPEKMYEVVHTEFTEEQARIYNDLSTKAVAWVEDQAITAMNAVSMINRLLQICSGQIKIEKDYIAIPTDRFEALKTYVEESETPVIIWSSFVQSSLTCAAHLGPLALHVPAGLTPTALYAKLQAFKTGQVKSIIANPASLGHGITLVESAQTAYISNTFNLEHRLQSEDRNHRIGQRLPVLYTDFITKGTVEERVLYVLKAKKSVLEFILNKARLKWLLTGENSKDFSADEMAKTLTLDKWDYLIHPDQSLID